MSNYYNARLARRKRTAGDVNMVTEGGMLDLIDNVIKDALRINDDEMDWLVENCTEQEMDDLITEEPDFATKRRIITAMDRLLTEFENDTKSRTK